MPRRAQRIRSLLATLAAPAARAGARRRAGRAARVALVACTAFVAGHADASSARPMQADPLVVDVVIDGAAGLAAFDATLRFDPAVVAVDSVTVGDALPAGSTWLGPTPDGDDGVVFGSYHEGAGPAGGDGTLATATFRVLGPGAPAIRLDRGGSGAYDSNGASIVPPARLALRGAPAEAIYLPYAMR